MNEGLPPFADYVEAMQASATTPLLVEMNVFVLTALLSTLQLALRHPEYPADLRPVVESFLTSALSILTDVCPVIGAAIRAGMDPGSDEDEEDTP